MDARRHTLFALLTGTLLSVAAARAADVSYDLVLRNARVVDGTGNPWYRADLAIRGDTIAGSLHRSPARQRARSM